MPSGRPDEPIPLPSAIEFLAAGLTVELVWRNELGGLTYRLGSELGTRYLKWAPANSGIDLEEEAHRLTWAIEFADRAEGAGRRRRA
jgi:kanamycin kinase